MAEPPIKQPPILRSARNAKRAVQGSNFNTVNKAVNNPTLKKVRGDGSVSPFPRARFMMFLGALKIVSRDEGLVPFELLGSQLYILDEICAGLAEGVTTFVILKSRQLGASTFFVALDLFWAFEYGGLLGAFVTHDESARDLFRNMIDVFLETLPRGFKVSQNKNNAKMLILKNMSLFRYLVAGQRSQSNKLGRSGGVNYAHCTEVAFWGSADDLASLNQTFSDIYPHRAYFFESTANGYNHFETMWQIAQDSPAQRAIFVSWWRDERYEFSENHPLYRHYMPRGTNTPLTEREKQGCKEVFDQYGHRITAGQIAWYRYHLETKCGGDEGTMDQEQPWVPEDAFQSTGSVFFANKDLTRSMKRAVRENKMWAFRVICPERFTEMQVVPVAQKAIQNAELKIWEMPSGFGRYCAGVDVASGTGNDDSVISIFRCYADCCFQVAEYADDDISTHRLAWVLGYLAGLFRLEMCNIEVTGPGMSVLQEIDRLKQDTHLMTGPDGESMFNIMARMRDFYYRRPDSIGGGIMRHWKQSIDTKSLLMNRYKNYWALDLAQIKSLTCLEQMRKIVITDTENIEAQGAYHDDKPVAAALAVYAWAEWLVPKLRASRFTLEHAKEIERHGGEDPVNGLMRKFMAERRIIVKDDLELDIRRA